MEEEWTGGRSGPLKFDPFPSTESLNIYKEKTFFLSSLKKILFPVHLRTSKAEPQQSHYFDTKN